MAVSLLTCGRNLASRYRSLNIVRESAYAFQRGNWENGMFALHIGVGASTAFGSGNMEMVRRMNVLGPHEVCEYVLVVNMHKCHDLNAKEFECHEFNRNST